MHMLLFPSFYVKPQVYDVRYDVTVKNAGSQTKEVSVVLPVPAGFEYQKFLKTPEFSPVDCVVLHEATFGNHYAVWKTELAGGEEKLFGERFTVRVEPRKAEVADDRIKEANTFVMSHLEYGNPIEGLYSASQAREKITVDCGGFDTLLQEELAKHGIESRIVSGFWESGKMHAWLEIKVGENWIPADPSMEQLRRDRRTKKSGELGFVGSDRIALSVGSFFEIEIGVARYPVDILQNPLIIPEEGITYEKHFYCTRA